MKILHLVPYFPPDRIGGVGEVAAHVHKGLLELGHESRVLTSGTHADDSNVVSVGSSPIRFGLLSILRARESAGVDLVHAHHGEGLLFLARARVRRDRPRILLTMHIENRHIGDSYRPFTINGRRFGSGWPGWWERHVKARIKSALDRAAMALADQVTYISKSTAVDVLGSDAADAATVVYNGLPKFPDTNGSIREAEPVELLYVGTPSLRKRTDLLPLILATVRQDHPQARLRIVGFDLATQTGLRGLFVELGLLDSVVCEGPIGSKQIRKFYRAAQVLVVPSAYEGLPMVIMEAFQTGLPAVATDVGGNSEIIEDGINGFLVPVDEPDVLAKRCVSILSDSALRARMSATALETASGFNSAEQILAYIDIYNRLARPSRSI